MLDLYEEQVSPLPRDGRHPLRAGRWPGGVDLRDAAGDAGHHLLLPHRMCTGYPPRCSRWDTKRSRPPWSACKAGWRSGGSPSFWARNSHGRSAAATRRGARRHPRPSRAGGWRAAALDRAPRRSSRSAAGSTTAAIATCAASPSTPRRSFRRADNRPSSAAPDPTASCGSSWPRRRASAGSRWAAAAPECPPSPPAAGRTEWSD